MQSTFKALIGILIAALLGGCAFGRTYSYSEVPMTMAGVTAGGTVAVAVVDERTYVTSGAKPERFVGLMRGGFGNPFDVNTSSGRPLAEEMRDGLVRAMKEKGIGAVPVATQPRDSANEARRRALEAKPYRAVIVTLHEWKSDTLMSTDLHYDLMLAVLDAGGQQLAEHSLKGVDKLGSLGLSPSEGVARASAKKLDQLFDYDKVVAALK